MDVKRTERGWAGHFICSARCLFRRNTLLEAGETRIVVSTVGNMVDIHHKNYPNEHVIVKLSGDRCFETMAFQVKKDDTKYLDADISTRVAFDSPGIMAEEGDDIKANDMHEAVVAEIADKMGRGELTVDGE